MSARRGEHRLALLPAVLAALLLGWALMGGVARAMPSFPPLNGQRVVDQANVLPAPTRAELTTKLADLEAKTSRQLVVVTLSDLQGYDIADYGYQLGRAWGIGKKGTNNGALFIIAPKEHKTRIEVGYGLEPILTDALTSVILQERVLPKFKAGDMPGGIVDGTNALIDQLSLDPSAAEQKAAAATQQQRHASRQTGGGRSSVFGAIWALFIVAIVLSSVFRRGRRGFGGGLFWPLLFLGGGNRGWGSGGGGWSDGGGSSSDDGGGGFSGGGGSFGGGGSSGSW